MSDYLLDHAARRDVPQSEPMRADQVANNADGHVWEASVWDRLRRFLILGSEGGSYYASERELTLENVAVVNDAIAESGLTALGMIQTVSTGGLAPKNDPALFALAVALTKGDPATRRAAAEMLPHVARTGTHLFQFVAYAEAMRGWGRALRGAVANWYGQDVDRVAFQAIKYRQRNGWSHRDVLRLGHVKPATPAHDALYAWIVGKEVDLAALPPIVDVFEAAQHSTSPAQTAAMIRATAGGVPREALVPDHLTDVDVWRAMLERGMPAGALVRNLANMTRLGVFDSGVHLRDVTDQLDDPGGIKHSRIHPLAILTALSTYKSGRGRSNTWTPHPTIIDALDSAFYLAFENVPASGKRHLLALDVSGSMANGQVAGSPLTPREASVAMALVTLHAEPDCEVVGFTGGLVPLPLSRRQRLDDAIASVSHLPFDRTDCAQPFLYALRNRREIDAFVVYTDSETWHGQIHPKQALDRYRAELGRPDARSAVVGMVANRFTIADPTDRGMLDLVGFDAAAPALLAQFAAGNV